VNTVGLTTDCERFDLFLPGPLWHIGWSMSDCVPYRDGLYFSDIISRYRFISVISRCDRMFIAFTDFWLCTVV